MNKARLDSTRHYFEAQDSYNIANVLDEARQLYKPFGLPLSVSLTKISDPSSNDCACAQTLTVLTTEKLISSIRDTTEVGEHRFSETQISNDIDNIELGIPGFDRIATSCSTLIRSTVQKIRTRLKGGAKVTLPSSAHLPGSSIEDTRRQPVLKTYIVSLTNGLQLSAIEISINCKPTIWDKVTQDRRCQEPVGLKSIVLSENGSSLVVTRRNDIRIIVLAGSGGSLIDFYEKTLADLTLIQNQIRQEPQVDYDPGITCRLNHAFRVCKELRAQAYSSSDQQDPVTSVESREDTVIECQQPDMRSSESAVQHIIQMDERLQDDTKNALESDTVQSGRFPFDKNDNLETGLDLNGSSKNFNKSSATAFVNEMLTKWSSLSTAFKKTCGSGQIFPCNLECTSTTKIPIPPTPDVRRIFSNSNLAHGLPAPTELTSQESESCFANDP